MKKIIYALTLAGLVSVVACKSKPSDAELQSKVVTAVTVPGVTTEVKEGVATLSGTVADDAAKADAEAKAKGIEGIKSVVNNITVTPPVVEVAAPVVSPDADLIAKVADATKDFAGVTTEVKDGVIVVKGEIKGDKWRVLKMALDALGPKKVDASSLKVN
jgi:hypothetical protein